MTDSSVHQASRDADAILSIRDLNVGIPDASGRDVPILRHIDIDVPAGRILGVVGESGAGKSMLMRAVMGILPARAHRSWTSISFDGEDLTDGFERRRLPISMVFQEPMSSFDPVRRLGYSLVEVARRFHRVDGARGTALSVEALASVGIEDPARMMRQYPHQLSGGMLQRAMIAMALLADPRMLVADEPTTALDATTQAQILALLADVQRRRQVTMIVVTHDLGVVAALCDDVAVMRHGLIIERGSVDEVFAHPQDDYTRMLLDSVPTLDEGYRTMGRERR